MPQQPLRAAWGFVQRTQPGATSGTGTTLTAAFGSNVTTGGRVIVGVELNENTGTGTGAAITVSTSSGTASLGTYRSVVQTANLNAGGGFSCIAAIWTVPVVTGGSLTVQAKGGNAANTWQLSMVIAEYSNLSTVDTLAGAVDVSAASAWDPATFQVVSPATSAANELVIGTYADDGASNTITAGGSFTQRGFTGSSVFSETALEDLDSGASGSTPTVTFTGGTNNDKACLVAVFKLAGAAGGTQSLVSYGYGPN